jgi:hypothetical protein
MYFSIISLSYMFRLVRLEPSSGWTDNALSFVNITFLKKFSLKMAPDGRAETCSWEIGLKIHFNNCLYFIFILIFSFTALRISQQGLRIHVFWNVTLCHWVSASQCFERTSHSMTQRHVSEDLIPQYFPFHWARCEHSLIKNQAL